MTLSIILVRPQLGENIGAAARVMKNFDLTDLRIVAPRDGWPNVAAESMSAGAKDLLDKAKLYPDTASGIADLNCVYATTGRMRDMEKPIKSGAEAMTALCARASAGETVGMLFGPERSGLDNDDLVLCDALVTIPVGQTYPSLNLAQAVAIICYEWVVKCGELTLPEQKQTQRASKAELQSFFDDLEAKLDARNFWKVLEKKPVMWRNIRNMLQHDELSQQEVRTLRGIINCLTER